VPFKGLPVSQNQKCFAELERGRRAAPQGEAQGDFSLISVTQPSQVIADCQLPIGDWFFVP